MFSVREDGNERGHVRLCDESYTKRDIPLTSHALISSIRGNIRICVYPFTYAIHLQFDEIVQQLSCQKQMHSNFIPIKKISNNLGNMQMIVIFHQRFIQSFGNILKIMQYWNSNHISHQLNDLKFVRHMHILLAHAYTQRLLYAAKWRREFHIFTESLRNNYIEAKETGENAFWCLSIIPIWIKCAIEEWE